jgi:Photosynthesis system II assembly factor YCF48/Putative zinc-finger
VRGEINMDPITKLVSERLRKQDAGPHPDADLLSSFAEGGLADAERRKLMAHLADCGECRHVLFLSAQAPAEAQNVPAFKFRRVPRFALGWGTLAAALVVGALLFMNDRKRTIERNGQTVAQQQKPGASGSMAAEMKAPPEIAEMRAQHYNGSASTTNQPEQREGHAALKHMTAKPQGSFEVDQSGQVHLQSSAKAKLAPEPNSSAANRVAADQIEAAASPASQQVRPERPLATNQSVAVSGAPVSATTNVSVQSEAVASDAQAASLQKSAATANAERGAVLAVLPVTPQWELSPDGDLQRSLDVGKTWRTISVGNGEEFTTLFSLGPNVWVGGKAGVLYHSADSGQTWAQVSPSASGRKLTAEVVHVEFSTPMNGTVTTAGGEIWSTADGGVHWQVK